MTVADYATTTDAIPLLGEATWSITDTPTLQTLLTAVSRAIDRETGRTPGFWNVSAPATLLYSGASDTASAWGMSRLFDVGIVDPQDGYYQGAVWLDIDPFDTITAVTMCQAQDRSDAVTLDFTDPTSAFYAVKYPLSGPPYDRLYSGVTPFYPDRFRIGNIAVTGTRQALPPELKLATCLWAAHLWKARKANFANLVIQPDGSAIRVSRDMPADVARLIGYFQEEEQRILFV